MSLPYSTAILKPFHRFRRLAGVDRAVFYSILSKAFSTAGSLITIPLILTRLTSVEQGFYYTFGSILALQVFLEMGFGAVAVQMVAHESAHLKIDLKSGYQDRPASRPFFCNHSFCSKLVCRVIPSCWNSALPSRSLVFLDFG